MESFTENNVAEAANDKSDVGKDSNGAGSIMYKAEDHVTEAIKDKVGNNFLEVGNDIAATKVIKVEAEENRDEPNENDPNQNAFKAENLSEAEDLKDGAKTDDITKIAGNPVQNKNDHVKSTGVISDEQKWPGWPGETVFRILVPHYRIGGLIGKKGDIIKKICEESKTRVKVLDTAPGAPERAVLVSAKDEPDLSIPPAIDGLLRVHNRIIDGLAGEPLAPSKSGNPEVTRMLAGATQTGTLIGKQGVNIKSIQDASNCVIRVIDDVPPFALPDDKVVEIQGDPSGMHKAVELIASHLRKYLVDRSVVQVFEMEMSKPVPQQQHHHIPPPQPWGPPPQGAPHAGGPPAYNQNPHYMPPRPHDSYYPPHEVPPPYEKPTHHGISTFGRDMPPAGAHSSNSSQANQATQHIQVPISFADAVIGAAGSNISYIRRTSGATITIQESKGVPGEMTVEINGSATSVQIAQQLIQNYMAEAGASAAQNTAPQHPDPYSASYAAPPYAASAYPPSAYGSAAPDPYGAPTASAPSSAAGYGGAYSSAYGSGYGY